MTGATRIVLDVLTSAAVAVAEGTHLDDVVAERLGQRLALDAAMVVRVPLGAPARVSAHWPGTDVDDLLARHVEVVAARLVLESVGGGRCRTGTWTERSIMFAVVGPVGPTGPGRPTGPRGPVGPGVGLGVARVVALVRPTAFGPEEFGLWADAGTPLAALFGLADRADARPSGAAVASGVESPVALGTAITDRERDVLELLAQGLTAMAIASRLRVSPRTVHRHLDNAYRKLGVHDRMLAVGAARRHGLICATDDEEALG